MRLTPATVAVAHALLNPPQTEQWGHDIARRAESEHGTTQPILQRMVHVAWLTTQSRGGRRYYEVTDRGRTELNALLARARAKPRLARLLRELDQNGAPGE